MPDPTAATTNVLSNPVTHDATKFVLPTASDQWSAIFNAPISFFLAVATVVAAIAVAIWKALEWRYGGIIEKTRTMVELAKAEAAYSKTRESELKETVKTLESQIKDITQKTVAPAGTDLTLAKEDRAKLEEILNLAHTASVQLLRLSTANNAVSDSLSRIVIGVPTLTTYPPTTTVSRNDALLASGGNWPRNRTENIPPQSTGGSG